MEITKLPLNPLISPFSRNMHKPYSILFFHFLHSNHSNLMPYTSISLTPNQFQHITQMHYQTLTNHSLYCSKPNIIHFFLILYQKHHDSPLNTTNLTSIQENQSIKYEKHKSPTFPPLELTCFLSFPWHFSLATTWRSLEELEGGEKLTSHTCSTFFFYFSLISFLFSLFFSLFLS